MKGNMTSRGRLQSSLKSSRENSMMQRQKSQNSQKRAELNQYEQKPMFIIKIEVGHDQFEEIKYYENDNPLTLAQIFSQKYNMSQAHIDILAQQLAQRIEEEQLQKLKVREQIKQQVLRDIEQDAKEYTLRSKSRKSFRNGPSNNDENMQQQQVYNRLYNIAVVKQQKQQQILQERKSLEQQNRTLSANRSMARSNTMRSFTSQGFNTSQSRIQSFCGTMNSSTQQSFINNQIHYSGSYGDRMFLMQTKKQELKSMHDEMNSILKNTEFYDSHNNSINKNSNLDQTYLSTMLHQKLNQSQNHRSAHNHSQNTFIASYNSKFLCENRPMSPPEEILLDYGKKYQKNLELKKQQQEQYELDKCTFKPVLDEKRLNKYLQNTKKNLYEILYSDDKVRQNKFQEIQNQIQQGIKLQQNRATLSKERSPVTQIQEITERVTNQVLASRQKWIKDKTQEKLKYETQIDHETGQSLFKPIITKSDRKLINNERNTFILANKENNIDLLESLYLEGKIIKAKQEEIFKKTQLEATQQIQIDQNSRVMAEQKQLEKLSQLFHALDSDQDGFISSQEIDLSLLSNKALDLMTQFLITLEASQSKLDQVGFVSEISKTIQNLSIVERDELLNQIRELKNTHLSFKPQLTEKTIKMAEKRSKSRTEKDFLEYLYNAPTQSIKNYQQALNKDKADQVQPLSEKLLHEIQECTFKPFVSPHSQILAEKAKQRKKQQGTADSGCKSQRNIIRHSINQPIMEKKNQELQYVMKKKINLKIQ
eukprot:403354057